MGGAAIARLTARFACAGDFPRLPGARFLLPRHPRSLSEI